MAIKGKSARLTRQLGILVLSVLASSMVFAAPKASLIPNSADGGPIVGDPYCGYNVDRDGWIMRDLGQGVNLEIGVSPGGKNAVKVTLLFRYYDGQLVVRPDQIRLKNMGTNLTYKPAALHREAYQPNGRCQPHGEWVILEFPLDQEPFKGLEVIFPDGTVEKRRPIRVKAFRFQRKGKDGA